MMKKTVRRILACALATTLTFGTAMTSFAAPASPVKPGRPINQQNVSTDKGKEYIVDTSKNGSTEIVSVKKSSKAQVTVASKVKVQGVTYTVKTIGPNAFKKCKKVKTIVLPPTVTRVKKSAFGGCKTLKTVILKCKAAAKVDKAAFKGLNTKKMTVKVKAKMSAKAYRKCVLNLRKSGFKGKIVKA